MFWDGDSLAKTRGDGHVHFRRHDVAHLMNIQSRLMRPDSLRIAFPISAPKNPKNQFGPIRHGVAGKAINPSKHFDPFSRANPEMKIGVRDSAVFCLLRGKISLLTICYLKESILRAHIAKRTYKCIVDLGSGFEIMAHGHTDVSRGLGYLSSSTIQNVFNERATIEHYLLPQCKIGSAVLTNLFLGITELKDAQTDLKIKNSGTVSQTPLISLGQPLLNRTNLFFDFPNSLMWFVRDFRDLKKIGFKPEDYQIIPFTVAGSKIVLEITSDLGLLRFWLDTGATGSAVKTGILEKKNLLHDELGNRCFLSKSFVLNGFDYGSFRIYTMNISEHFEKIDGILGMDFLRKVPFYIDYENRLIFFKKP